MAKRFLDTTIIEKKWFSSLTSFEQASWFYLLCKCDAVGVYDINPKLEKALIGNKVDWNLLCEKSNNHIELFNKDKIFIVKYCQIQYGNKITDLNTKCKPIQSHQELLFKHRLFERVSNTVSNTVKEKEKNKKKEEEDSVDFEEMRKKIGIAK